MPDILDSVNTPADDPASSSIQSGDPSLAAYEKDLEKAAKLDGISEKVAEENLIIPSEPSPPPPPPVDKPNKSGQSSHKIPVIALTLLFLLLTTGLVFVFVNQQQTLNDIRNRAGIDVGGPGSGLYPPAPSPIPTGVLLCRQQCGRDFPGNPNQQDLCISNRCQGSNPNPCAPGLTWVARVNNCVDPDSPKFLCQEQCVNDYATADRQDECMTKRNCNGTSPNICGADTNRTWDPATKKCVGNPVDKCKDYDATKCYFAFDHTKNVTCRNDQRCYTEVRDWICPRPNGAATCNECGFNGTASAEGPGKCIVRFDERPLCEPAVCSEEPNPTKTPTRTPTITPIVAQCTNIKIYKGGQVVTPSTLKTGDAVVIGVTGGNATKAHVRVNGGSWIETTTKNSVGEYTVSYTLPSGVTNFTIESEIYGLDGAWH